MIDGITYFWLCYEAKAWRISETKFKTRFIDGLNLHSDGLTSQTITFIEYRIDRRDTILSKRKLHDRGVFHRSSAFSANCRRISVYLLSIKILDLKILREYYVWLSDSLQKTSFLLFSWFNIIRWLFQIKYYRSFVPSITSVGQLFFFFFLSH